MRNLFLLRNLLAQIGVVAAQVCLYVVRDIRFCAPEPYRLQIFCILDGNVVNFSHYYIIIGVLIAVVEYILYVTQDFVYGAFR